MEQDCAICQTPQPSLAPAACDPALRILLYQFYKTEYL